MENGRRIIDLAHLIAYLIDTGFVECKVNRIKASVATGLITPDEAIDLTVEYCTE